MASEFTTYLIKGIIGIAGNIVAISQTDTQLKEEKSLMDEHYKKSTIASKKYEEEIKKKREQEPVEVDFKLSKETEDKIKFQEELDHGMDKLDRVTTQYTQDLTEDKISDGTACLPCSRDHFTIASSVMDEATRFATREKGMRDPEVRKRIQAALKELNAMERIDLSPENTASLQGKEHELATWAKNSSADIRHMITNARSPQDLERVASKLSQVAQKFGDDVWDLALEGGSIDKHIDDICKGLDGEEQQRCLDRINRIMDERSAK